jgi:hypothetical protein
MTALKNGAVEPSFLQRWSTSNWWSFSCLGVFRRRLSQPWRQSNFLLISVCFLVIGSRPAHAAAGAALSFDGLNDYATIFPGFQFLSDWTFEMWLKPIEPLTTVNLAGEESQRCLVSMHTGSLKNLVTLTYTADLKWHVIYGHDLQTVPFQAWLGSVGRQARYSASPQHVVLSHQVLKDDQSNMRLYVNSTIIAEWFVDPTVTRKRPEPPLPVPLALAMRKDEERRLEQVRAFSVLASSADTLRKCAFGKASELRKRSTGHCGGQAQLLPGQQLCQLSTISSERSTHLMC